MTSRIVRLTSVLLLVLSILFLWGCGETPTTLVISVDYYDDDRGPPPASSFLYIRMMQTDGTVVWSNEAAPRQINNLSDGDLFRYVLTPSDAILTDPADLYMFDAYFYTNDLSPAAIDPTDPGGGGDPERFTFELVPFNPAPHLVSGVKIVSGTQRHINLRTYFDL